jgi:hypothetical protein
VSDGRRSSKAEDLKPTAKDIGLSHKQVHEARAVRDAEQNDPGVVRKTLWPLLAAPDCHPKRYGLKRGTSAVLNPCVYRKPYPSLLSDRIG